MTYLLNVSIEEKALQALCATLTGFSPFLAAFFFFFNIYILILLPFQIPITPHESNKAKIGEPSAEC